MKSNFILINAENKILGRLVVIIIKYLKMNYKINYNIINIKNYIFIINSKKIILTGNKLKKKIYIKHTGYPGGKKTKNFLDLLKKSPSLILKKAILNMLPKNKLSKSIIKRIKIYPDSIDINKFKFNKIIL